jgi:probable phosphoglycerate mutase
MRLLLTRHGHVEGIKPARFRGRAELELTPTGLAQADAIARRIARQWQPAAIYTSGLQRCIVTEAFRLWHTAPHLMRFPKGESLQDVLARTSDALRTVLARHRTDTVVMVGHDSVNRALLLQLLDQPLAAYWKLVQDPCTLNEVVVDPDRIQVLRLNDTSHLP